MGKKTAKKAATPKADEGSSSKIDAVAEELEKAVISPRSSTGVLASHPLSRDIRIDNFSLGCYGRELVTEGTIELNYGRRYGLIGRNGCGKSTFLQCLAEREVPIPGHIDIYLLDREVKASTKTALEAVLENVESERQRLETEAEELAGVDDQDSIQDRLQDLYDRLDGLDLDLAPKRAGEILFGLGFNKAMQNKATKEFSGGWRMRIALAKALFVSPALLLLDEPTNHLDLEACVWLEEYLKNFNRILVVISHSQDFLNGVCTNILLMRQQTLTTFSGNYDTYVRTREELEENQMKRYNWEQDQIAHMKEYIARFGHGSAKLARQAQSKEKVLAKMQAGGLTERVAKEQMLTFRFNDCGKLPPPVLQFVGVTFGYPNSEKGILYRKLDFGVDLDSRIALVGPNGAGKSTLLKLMVGELVPLDGQVKRNTHLRIARYHQHLSDTLDLDLSPLDFMMKTYPDMFEFQEWRSQIGRFGLTGTAQSSPIRTLSDGQKSRLVFVMLVLRNPHLLLLDEPTNHLDMETIDSLADAINAFEGGMVLVSHDFRLINQVAQEIWICDHRKVERWSGDIVSYKEHLRSTMAKYED
eukprot:TRINITY_DN7081_c0_g2_i4.p1 TRINITY_DN7081_c0_g2~~TRINITY_DN7081_c0_g2_i4.p1  ORF type:complete len:586 (-),score=161.08 TRINITY_DN7081_c0_g2_i4:542-2299(-)